jgi:hypothetical protein
VQDYLESAVKFLLRPRQRGSLYWITGSGQYRLKWLTFSPALTMEDINKNCSASPFTYVWSGPWKLVNNECIDGTNPPCTLMSDGHGNFMRIPKGQDDAKKVSK